MLAAALLLGGCRLDVEVGVDVAPDGSGVVRVEVLADAELAAVEPDALAQLRLDDLPAAGWEVDGPEPTPGGGVRLGLRKPFADPAGAGAVLAELNGPGGPLGPATLAVDRAEHRVTWRFEGSAGLSGLDAFGDADLEALVGVPLAERVAASGVAVSDAVGLRVRVRLPEELTYATVRPWSGHEATWEPSLAPGATTALVAEATVRSDAPRWEARAAWAAGAAAVVLAVEGLVLARRRHRRRRASTPAA